MGSSVACSKKNKTETENHALPSIFLSLLFSFLLYLHSLGAICLGHFYVGVDVGKGEEGG